jgi:precorrin-6B methylase 2
MTRWNGDSILGLCNFINIRVLLTAAELDLFSIIAPKPLTLSQIVAMKGLQEKPTRVLLDALVSMQLLQKQSGKYSCPTETARCLTSSARDSVLPMVQHLASVWTNVSKLTSVVQGFEHKTETTLSQEDRTRAFIGGMHVRARDNAARMVAELEADDVTKLIDIGGASGSYSIAFLRAHPQMQVTLFDLPFVIELARERLADAGLLDRTTLVPGDFYHDPLPRGHDMALLSAIIHQNSPEQNVSLFRKALQALKPEGRLVIRDYVMSPDHTSPLSGSLFAVNMLVATEGGSTYSFDEIGWALEKAGFIKVRQLRSRGEMDSLVEAQRPAHDTN